MVEAYQRIFTRCGLKFKMVEAESGLIGGTFSHEFMVLAETGEETSSAAPAVLMRPISRERNFEGK